MNARSISPRLLAIASVLLASAIALGGCSAAGVRGIPPANAPAELAAAAPDMVLPDAAKAGIVLKPTKLTLYGTGKISTTTVVVSEKGYKNKFTETNTCKKIATISPSTGKGPSFKVSVTAKAVGTCAVTFTDTKHHKAKLPVVAKKGGSLASSLIVPLRGDARRHPHGPKYISPSTQSMLVDITGPTDVSVVSGLTTTSPGCALTLQGLECDFGTGLAACPSSANCYTATVTTYDAYDPTTNTIPSGAAPLSIAKTSFGITANQTTNVSFPFSGVPAQIVVVPGSALSPQTGNVIDLVGPGAHPMLAEALDADNNVIAGIGGPDYTVSATGGLAVAYTQPALGSPRFTVTPPSALDTEDLSTLTVTAAYPTDETDGCAVSGAVCTGAAALDMQSLLAVGNSYSTTLYAAEKGLGPISTITSGMVNGTSSLAFDAKGDLFAAQSFEQVVEYALGSTIPSTQAFTGVSDPVKLAVDPAGNLFVLNAGNNTVTEYAPGVATPIKTTSVSIETWDLATNYVVYSLVVDPSDDFWVSSTSYSNSTGAPIAGEAYYYAHGASTGAELTGLHYPYSMTLYPDGDTLYVSDQTYVVPDESAQCGVSGNYCTIYSYTKGSTTPATLSSGAYCGNLFFAYSPTYRNLPTPGILYQDDACGTSFATYFTNGSTYAVFTGGQGQASSSAMAVDELGNVFYAENEAEIVTGFFNPNFQTGPSAPELTITDGISHPSSLAIVP